jgi:hypothetical protein
LTLPRGADGVSSDHRERGWHPPRRPCRAAGKKQRFGASSEKIEREIEQLELALESLETARAAADLTPEADAPGEAGDAPEAETAAPDSVPPQRRRGKAPSSSWVEIAAAGLHREVVLWNAFHFIRTFEEQIYQPPTHQSRDEKPRRNSFQIYQTIRSVMCFLSEMSHEIGCRTAALNRNMFDTQRMAEPKFSDTAFARNLLNYRWLQNEAYICCLCRMLRRTIRSA